jgi:hypothetical protein
MSTSTKDLGLFESGDGGELSIINSDLNLTETLYQTIYLHLFGGNVEASTLGNEIDGQERFDYWANELLFSERQSKQFNSETEATLKNVTVNSSGRLRIKSAVENDLSFLKNIINFKVNIVILSTDKIKIEVIATEISNQAERIFQYIWDNAKDEVVISKTI